MNFWNYVGHLGSGLYVASGIVGFRTGWFNFKASKQERQRRIEILQQLEPEKKIAKIALTCFTASCLSYYFGYHSSACSETFFDKPTCFKIGIGSCITGAISLILSVTTLAQIGFHYNDLKN